MLYVNKTLARPPFWMTARSLWRAAFASRRVADLDLLSMSPHLRRDIGLGEGEVWRK